MYRLHRETYHLAVDFIDRYLSATRGYLKSQLQLLGITSLFVAAKLEVSRQMQLLLSAVVVCRYYTKLGKSQNSCVSAASVLDGSEWRALSW